MPAELEGRFNAEEWENDLSSVGAMCDSDTYNAGTRCTTENSHDHDQDMQRVPMVCKSSGQWWPVCGSMGVCTLSQVGWCIGNSQPKMGKHCNASEVVVAAKSRSLETMSRISNHGAGGIGATIQGCSPLNDWKWEDHGILGGYVATRISGVGGDAQPLSKGWAAYESIMHYLLALSRHGLGERYWPCFNG